MLLTSLIHVDAIIRQRQQNCQCVFPSTFVVSFFAPAGAPLCGDCGNGLRFRPVRRGRNGEADGFLWRGSATTPARSAGQRRVWGGNPNKYQTRGTNERKRNLGHGSILALTLQETPINWDLVHSIIYLYHMNVIFPNTIYI